MMRLCHAGRPRIMLAASLPAPRGTNASSASGPKTCRCGGRYAKANSDLSRLCTTPVHAREGATESTAFLQTCCAQVADL
eukprot:CAMPEP_0198518602 /NCGR_PEP_ID=MMETSP1462-20131121/19218_1 /TAXON_ID=1333877 /ORGANISM="Brandtodinium nutriculum, Strain RCC3387" /LENGTH=79 /DNA_ID=CAMNT_0044248195 /DNA_START=106 /DNA_END=342 /DNA_ORIENTATION=-